MEVKYERCCGIDVHKKTVVACVIVPGAQSGEVEKETQTYATIADDLGALGQWLQAKGVTHIAMESTGMYWKPVFNLLEGQFAIVVVNAERIKAPRVATGQLYSECAATGLTRSDPLSDLAGE
jgi:transposase